MLAIREWDVVVDIGANYGEMLLATELPVAARVLCFEPNVAVLPFLRRSLAESGIAIELREVALGGESAMADFLRDTVWSGRSGLAITHRTDAHHPMESVTVPVCTLDSELKQELELGHTVCVKMDVEGAELEVLAGARTLVASHSPWVIMVEILHMDAFEKARLAREFVMRVMDRRTGELVTVPPASPQSVSALLDAGWCHSQDAVLTARDTA